MARRKLTTEEGIKHLGYSVVTIWESDFDKRGVV